MKDRKRNIIIAVIAVIVAVAAIFAWTWWRRDVTAKEQAERERQQTVQTPAKKDKDEDETKVDDATIQQRLDTAIRFERLSREWGVDPTEATSDSLALKPSMESLNKVRTPETFDGADLSDVSSITPDEDAGPNAPSRYCVESPDGAPCSMYPTQYPYWRQQHWTMGARLKGDPKATYNEEDGTVTVEGDVLVVLWSDVQDAAVKFGYWGYTPVTGVHHFSDTLSFNDEGKVGQRDVNVGTIWLADPVYGSWDDNPASETGSWDDRQQPSIPLQGEPPSLGLNHDVTRVAVKNAPDTESGQWVNVKGVMGLPQNL